MNSSKPIDISKSSLVGLKAELLRKQEEVKKLKQLQQNGAKPEIIQKKKSVQQKSNEGVEERRTKDTSVIEEDYDALKKSREVLEAKSRLYDKLKANRVDEQTKSKYLIDFDLKRDLDIEDTRNIEENDTTQEEEDYSDPNSDPENDWVDFVDTLGRSRRCLRKDLPEMKAKDAKLAVSLHPPSPPPDTTPTPTPELLSWDMQRELMRKKWEEEETLLIGKKDIHYQDVRFDEARPHGVGYFEFSKDEAERVRQQEELQKLRAHTMEQQEAAQGLRARRQQQLQARLAAARQRRRERLGLPPESPPHEEETPAVENEEEKKDVVEEETIIDLEATVKKVAPIRPWDIGKNKTTPVMSQDEWIEKKRQERPEEFAPPSSLIATSDLEISDSKWKTNPNVFTTKRVKHKSPFSEKSRQKNKKTKKKKLEKVRSHEEGAEDEDENVGPSVADWQKISQQNDMELSENISNQESYFPSVDIDRNIEPVKHNVSTLESRKEDTGPSTVGWKPTITDIDLLLSSSRAANFSRPEAEENRNHTNEPTLLLEFQKSMSTSSSENTVEQKFTMPSYTNSNVAKGTNCDNHTFKHSKRKTHEKDSANTSSKLFDNSSSSETIIKPIVNLLEGVSDDEIETSTKKCEEQSKWKSNKRKFAEIPPPPSMSYYIDAEKKNYNRDLSNKPKIADSISAGMNYLKTKTEEKSKKRLKGMLDFI